LGEPDRVWKKDERMRCSIVTLTAGNLELSLSKLCASAALEIKERVKD